MRTDEEEYTHGHVPCLIVHTGYAVLTITGLLNWSGTEVAMNTNEYKTKCMLTINTVVKKKFLFEYKSIIYNKNTSKLHLASFVSHVVFLYVQWEQ